MITARYHTQKHRAKKIFGDIDRLKGEPSRWHRRIGSYQIPLRRGFEQHLIVIEGTERRTASTY
jgi:hypothetical protein